MALAADRRRPRLARVRRLRALAAGDRRDPRLAPHTCSLRAARARRGATATRRFAPGLALGLAGAIKFFLWPLGVWLAAIGRARETLVAAAVAAASLLLVLPFTSLHDYFRVLIELGRTFDQDSYSPFGFLMQIGAPETLARVVMLALGAALLVACWRRASLGLAVAAALVLSPDRVARLLRRRRDPARRRPPAARRPSGSRRSRPGAS